MEVVPGLLPPKAILPYPPLAVPVVIVLLRTRMPPSRVRPALKLTSSGLKADLIVEDSMNIAPSAFRVRLRAPSALTLIVAPFTLMVPASAPTLAPPVEIVTFPLIRALAIVAELIDEPTALAV